MILRKIMHYPYEEEIEDSQQVFSTAELLRIRDGFGKMLNYLEPEQICVVHFIWVVNCLIDAALDDDCRNIYLLFKQC